MLFRGLLILFGLNQTLAIALVPQLVSFLGLSNSSQNLAIVTLIINVNLLTYWLGTAFWGDLVSKISIVKCTRIASIGFLFSNALFWSALFMVETPSLMFIAFSRLALGLFTSAFIILAHSHLAQITNTSFGQLAKISGAITLGRLIGPSLVLLPFSMEWLLLFPTIATGLFIPFIFFMTNTEPHKPAFEAPSKPINSPNFALILITALLTTILVSTVQYFILPLLFEMGYEGVLGSKVYAALLLYLTLTVIIYQFFVLPRLTPYLSIIPGLIIAALLISCTLFVVSLHNELLLIIALTMLTFAISALPSWYSQKAYEHNQTLAIRAYRSSRIARAHTTGHLLGTAISSLTLYLNLPLIIPIWIFSLSLIGLIITLHKHIYFKANRYLKYSTVNKEDHE